MASELYASRELTWLLLRRDFSAKHRQTVLGVLWVAISPLVMVAAFALLKTSGVVSLGDTKAPYPVFALLGLSLWHLFSGGINATSTSVVSSASFAGKVNFPKETLLLSSLGQPVVNAAIKFVLTGFVLAAYDLVPHWTAVLLPLAALPLLVLALGLGAILAFLNVMVRDFAFITGPAVTGLLFITPVLYATPPAGPLAAITRLNPLAHLIRAPRDLVLLGHLSDPRGFLISAAASAVVLLFAWRFFHLAEGRFAERIGK
jgi:lipopolysaccharide transport system permease protein